MKRTLRILLLLLVALVIFELKRNYLNFDVATIKDVDEAHDIVKEIRNKFALPRSKFDPNKSAVFAYPQHSRTIIIVYGIVDHEAQSRIVEHLKMIKEKEKRKPITIKYYEEQLFDARREHLLTEVKIQ